MPTSHALLNALRKRPHPGETLLLLTQLSRAKLRPAELLAYHEALLFYKAYPRSIELRRFCEKELNGFAARTRHLTHRERQELDQSSVAGTRVFYPYDEPMARWLVGQLGNDVDLDWEAYEERNDDPFADYMPLFMTGVENDVVDSADIPLRDLIENARGRYSTLEWLLDRFETLIPDPALRRQIYDSMQISLVMQLNPPGPSRTILDDGNPSRLALWNPPSTKKPLDLVAEIRRPLRMPKPVSRARARELMDLVYGTLLIRLRELYPATHVNFSEVYDIPLERGIRIIWFFMKPEMRLALEAGWGCLILKNNVPIGYGAGGMVDQQSEISINLYDTFRGGEAAWLYSQYARICYHWCRAPWLVTRKWQLGGEGNEEGLESGSFWFYDKLGFESVDPELRRLAKDERRKIATRNGYRSSRRVLLRLAQADMVYNLDGKSVREFSELPLDRVGMLATRVIARQFGGDRKTMQSRILKEMKERFGLSYEGWTRDERERFAQMSLLVLALPGIDSWPKSKLKSLIALCRAKGSVHEAEYAKLMPHNRQFFEELGKAAKALRVSKT